MKLDFARQDDLPRLAEISGWAFREDTHTALKSIAKGYGGTPADVARFHGDGSRDAFAMWLDDGGRDVVVVRDQHDVVIGFAVWAKFGYEDGHGRGPSKMREAGPGKQGKIPPLSSPLLDGPENVENLGKLTNAAMSYYVDQLKPAGSLCRYIVSISIHPSHQGKGVGKALIDWGFEKAAREGAYCWVSGNGNALGFYEKMGFVEVARLEVCLDDWAEGLKPEQRQGGSRLDDDRWGNYMWNWMRWDPVTAAA